MRVLPQERNKGHIIALSRLQSMRVLLQERNEQQIASLNRLQFFTPW